MSASLDFNHVFKFYGKQTAELLAPFAAQTNGQVEFFDWLFAAVGGTSNVAVGTAAGIANPAKPWWVYTGPHHVHGKKGGMFKPQLRSRETFNSLLDASKIGGLHVALGISKDTAHSTTCLFVEMDEGSYDEQAARLDLLESQTGLAFGWVHSGNKSIHAYLALSEVASLSDEKLLQVQKQLIILLSGDPAIASGLHTRSMRLPGFNFDGYEQKILKTTDALYSLDTLALRLNQCFKLRGLPLGSVEHLMGMLKVAQRCRAHIRHIDKGEYSIAAVSSADLAKYASTLSNYDETHLVTANAMLHALDQAQKEASEAKKWEAAKDDPVLLEKLKQQKEAASKLKATKANGVKTVDPTIALTVTGGWDADTITHAEIVGHFYPKHKGSSATGVTVVCPHCAYEKDPAACKVYYNQTGVALRCFHCNTVIKFKKDLDLTVDHSQFAAPDDYTNTKGKYIGAQPIMEPILAGRQIVYVKSPKGSGKTTACAATIAKLREAWPACRVLVCTHRTSLARALAYKYDTVCYKDEDADYNAEGDMAICVDSLGKLPPWKANKTTHALTHNTYSLIVIDEASQVFNHMLSPGFSRHYGMRATSDFLCEQVSHGATVVLMDADMSEYTVATMRTLLGRDAYLPYEDEAYVHHTNTKEEFNRKLKLTVGSQARAAGALAAVAQVQKGKFVVVPCTDRSDSESIGRELQNKVEDIYGKGTTSKILVVNSATSPKLGAFLTSPDTYLQDHPEIVGLVYSPSMSTGLDLSAPYKYGKVIAIAHAGSHTNAREIMQGLVRCRNPIDREYEIYLQNAEYDGNTDHNLLYSEHMATGTYALQVMRQYGVDPSEAAGEDAISCTTVYAASIVEAENNIDLTDTASAIANRADREGWVVTAHNLDGTNAEMQEMSEAINKTKKQMEDNRDLLILHAEAYAGEDAYEEARKKLEQPLSEEEAASAHRTIIDHIVGADLVDCEVIRKYRHDTLVDSLDLHLGVKSFLFPKSEGAEKYLKAQMGKEFKRLKRSPSGHSRVVIAHAYADLIRTFARSKDPEDDNKLLFVETKQTYKVLEKILTRLAAAGHKFKGYHNPYPIINEMFKRLGWVASRVTKGKGGATSGVSLLLGSVKRMDQLSARRRDKIMQGGVWDFALTAVSDQTIDTFVQELAS